MQTVHTIKITYKYWRLERKPRSGTKEPDKSAFPRSLQQTDNLIQQLIKMQPTYKWLCNIWKWAFVYKYFVIQTATSENHHSKEWCPNNITYNMHLTPVLWFPLKKLKFTIALHYWECCPKQEPRTWDRKKKAPTELAMVTSDIIQPKNLR